MRKYKQTICILLIFSIIFSSSLSVFAGNINAKKVQIISALQNAEYIKGDMGLENIDFTDIRISNPIHTYEYLTTGLVKDDILSFEK